MSDLRIVQLDLPTLEALAAGDHEAAARHSGLPVTPWLAGPEALSTWRRRVVQLRASDRDQPWTTGIVLLSAEHGEIAVGKAGFHEAPDDQGRVELGYAIDPVWRRRGYAGRALGVLLERARREPEVRVVVASVRPDNEPSLRLVRAAGFVHVGEEMDDEDGLEWVFELTCRESGPDLS